MYVIYSQKYDEEPVFHYTTKTIHEANDIISDLIDEKYSYCLGKALDTCCLYLEDLINKKEFCNYAPAEIVVLSYRFGSIYFDYEEDWEEEVERCINGEYIAEYINDCIPRYKIGRTVD